MARLRPRLPGGSRHFHARLCLFKLLTARIAELHAFLEKFERFFEGQMPDSSCLTTVSNSASPASKLATGVEFFAINSYSTW